MTKEVDFLIEKHFSGHTLKNMSLIKHVVNPSALLDMTFVGSRSMTVDNYPFFSQEETKEVLEYYNDECLAKGRPQEVLVYRELPETHEYVYSLKRKRKTISSEEGPSEYVRTLTKVASTSGLSILKDTMRPEAEHVRSETVRVFEVTPSGNHRKTPMTEALIHSVSSVMYLIYSSSTFSTTIHSF